VAQKTGRRPNTSPAQPLRHISASATYYKEYTGEPNPDDENDDGTRRVARASYVFNAAQIDGYTVGEPPERLGPVARIEAADRFLTHTGARIEVAGERAYYRPSTDTIHMPDEGLFTGTDTMNRSEAWYATALHESTHWSGAKHRLNRDFGKRFGDQQYVAEELVAEIASAFLCAELSVTQDTRPDHAQYLAHWLKLLKDDNRAIFTAAAKASEAVTYLKSLQPPEPEPPGGRRPGSAVDSPQLC
jgi:antirestriction protein ArdC